MSCGFEFDSGSYVLGALAPDDRTAFEQHLPTCGVCTRSVGEFAGLPGLLARVPVDVLETGLETPPVPATLLPSLIGRAQRVRRRRTWAAAGLVAAAVAGIGLAVGVTVGNDSASPSAAPSSAASTAAPQPFEPVGAQPISGWVSLTKVGWGTRLDLTCSYADQKAAYAGGWAVDYTMVVTHRDGTIERVASWKALPGKTMHLSGATSSQPADIARVDVRTTGGAEVLRLVTG
jgi:hypothetical protein